MKATKRQYLDLKGVVNPSISLNCSEFQYAQHFLKPGHLFRCLNMVPNFETLSSRPLLYAHPCYI